MDASLMLEHIIVSYLLDTSQLCFFVLISIYCIFCVDIHGFDQDLKYINPWI